MEVLRMKGFVKVLSRGLAVLCMVSALMGCAKESSSASATPSDGLYKFTGPIQLVCAQATGAVSDTSCRLFAKSLTRTIGQNVVVLNITGGGGTPAAHKIADAPADGTTLMYIEESNLTNYAIGACDMAWSDFDLVALFGGTGTTCFLASSTTGVKNFADLKKYYETKGPLSMAITYGQPSLFMTAAIEKASGVKLRNVDVNTGSDKILAVVSGQLEMTQLGYELFDQYVKNGQMNVIGSVGGQRSKNIPDIPTFNEQGCNIGDFYKFWGVAYKKGTDPHIISSLSAYIKKTMEDPQTIADYKALMFDINYYDTKEAIDYVKGKDAFYNDIAQFIFSTQAK
jgi:tripartite-type tricarboxylate transporter receptor subunit TctC